MSEMTFKLQFRLWHIFALTAVVGLLCAFPSVRFVAAGTLGILLLAYAITLGCLLICRLGLAMAIKATEWICNAVTRRTRATPVRD